MIETLHRVAATVEEEPLDAYSRIVSTVAEQAGPAVVRVENRNARGGGSGWGFVIARDGLVVTNGHVVCGARQLRLTLTDGNEIEAQVIGDDGGYGRISGCRNG